MTWKRVYKRLKQLAIENPNELYFYSAATNCLELLHYEELYGKLYVQRYDDSDYSSDLEG